jgi:hypothetical protein
MLASRISGSPTARAISRYEVLPLHPVCAHAQSMSGVFSMASHWVLQYLPDVVMQEQTGCAHFSDFGVVICFSSFRINCV